MPGFDGPARVAVDGGMIAAPRMPDSGTVSVSRDFEVLTETHVAMLFGTICASRQRLSFCNQLD
jgi:hypothetical protein